MIFWNIKTLAKKRAAEKNYQVLNENEYTVFYQAYGITPMEVSEFTKIIKEIDPDLKLTHIPSARVARLISEWESKELESLIQGPTWAISSNNKESFKKLMKIKDENLNVIGGICEGHVTPVDSLKKYPEMEDMFHKDWLGMNFRMSQVLYSLHRGISTDLTETIKKVS